MKAAQAASIAAAAQQQQKQEKELLWEDQACTRCGSKVGPYCHGANAIYMHQVLLLLQCYSDQHGHRWKNLSISCNDVVCQLQEDGPDTEEGLMLLCDGCNKGTHMRCVAADL